MAEKQNIDNPPIEEDDAEQRAQAIEPPQRNWRDQIIGSVLGAFIFYILGGLLQYFGVIKSPIDRFWLWGAVIGGLFGSTDSLNIAGARLTNSENKGLNILVSLVGMVIIFTVVYAIASLINRLIPI
ncbi:MAG: hypothetical protein P1S60_13110 [Anaerolineae bacterium]|nr:hypothetical protein [Anaerolineae bacterium]